MLGIKKFFNNYAKAKQASSETVLLLCFDILAKSSFYWISLNALATHDLTEEWSAATKLSAGVIFSNCFYEAIIHKVVPPYVKEDFPSASTALPSVFGAAFGAATVPVMNALQSTSNLQYDQTILIGTLAGIGLSYAYQGAGAIHGMIDKSFPSKNLE